ncbi:unnamed protein product [Ilex paraguariensis]|uniref:RNA cytosine-C(5)-methyltransferase NSUN2-like pre-PUA domain-containing protein n=1 Tax=Ilex paraguariensis TaxID=185542 RepID=A0ABC8T5D0_9AQUA
MGDMFIVSIFFLHLQFLMHFYHDHIIVTIFSRRYFISLSAAIQKKPITMREKLNCSDDIQVERLIHEVKEDKNGVGVDNETEEAALDPDTSTMSEENEPEEVPGDMDTGPEVVRGKKKLQIQGKWRGVDPVVFFRDDVIVDGIKAFYGIKESFPFSGHLVTRNSDTNHVKRIYYISNSVKEILELNFLAGQQLKITSIGLKMFVSFSFTVFAISLACQSAFLFVY